MNDKTRITIPKIAFQTPSLTIARTACASDAKVVVIDMEKMESRRKRNAGTWTPLDSLTRDDTNWRENGGNSSSIKGAAIKVTSETIVAESQSQ